MPPSAGGHEVSVCMDAVSVCPLFSAESPEISTLLDPLFCSIVQRSSVSAVRFNSQSNGKNTFKSLVSSYSLRIHGGWRDFNLFTRLHCERVHNGFASIKAPGSSYGLHGGDSTVSGEDDNGVHISGRDSAKKVLILMSDTGGGHRASAEAIKAAFQLEFGDEYKVSVTDLWKDHTPWPFNQIPRSYSFLVKHGTLWKAAFHGTAPRIVHQTNFAATHAFIAREVTKGLMKYQPDIIVSVHPLMQHVPLHILKKRGLLKKILFTTVITDLSTCHPTWFHKLVTRCYCPTPEVARRAGKAGLQPGQIRVYGLPVRPSFCKSIRPKDELRKDLGMDEDLPAVLLMGGGEGMGPVEATSRALGETLYNRKLGEPVGQLIVICGRNRKLANKLQSIEWKMPVQIRGFETNMEEWMGACDCIITKAGPGTIAEAMIRGLPIILNDYIAGQMELIEHRQKRLEQDPLPLTSVLPETSDTQSKAKISSLEFRKVVGEGVYDESKSIYIGPRSRSVSGITEIGYFVVTPLMPVQRNGSVQIPVLVNRGWVPRSWRDKAFQNPLKATSEENIASSEKDKSKGGSWWKFWLKKPANVKDVDSYFKMVKVIGVIRGSESPNIFVPLNDPDSGQWFYVDVPAIARAAGLPENALYVEEIEEAHNAGNPYPVPKDASSFIRYSVMPQDHLNYALTWYTLSAATTFMAKKRLQNKKLLR